MDLQDPEDLQEREVFLVIQEEPDLMVLLDPKDLQEREVFLETQEELDLMDLLGPEDPLAREVTGGILARPDPLDLKVFREL